MTAIAHANGNGVKLGRNTWIPVGVVAGVLLSVAALVNDRAEMIGRMTTNEKVDITQERLISRLYGKLDALYRSNTRIELKLGTLPNEGIVWPTLPEEDLVAPPSIP